MADAGRWMMIMGAALFVLGAVVSLGSRLPWFGRLPGDVVYKGDNVTVFLPIATMIVVSVVLTIVVNVVIRLLR